MFTLSASLWLAAQYCAHRAGLLLDDKIGVGDFSAAQIWSNRQTALLYSGLLTGWVACDRVRTFSRAERFVSAAVFFCTYSIASVLAPLISQAA